MSSITLSPNASGTGIFTVAAPNSNTNQTLTLPNASGTLLTNSGTEPGAFSTLSVAGNNISAVNSLGFRNRIINGNMVIDQRNGGGSVTPTSGQYLLDRWRAILTQSSKYSVQQNAGSVTPPVGFTHYFGVTSLSAYAITGNDTFNFEQIIEGFNLADFNWGTANAVPATLSFWARSSLTGTFGGSIATTRTAIWVMPFSFTISSANTWTFVTIPVTAPTGTGGANTSNSDGAYIRFGLGSTGTSAGGTAGVWTNASNFIQPAGTVSVVGTNGATFYVTGVQLEAGTVATPFEQIDYGRELMMCQRYYYENPAIVGTGLGANAIARATGLHPVEMRSGPAVTVSNTTQFFNGSATVTCTGTLTNYSTTRMFNADLVIGGSGSTGFATAIVQPPTGKITVSAELG